MRDKILL